MSPLDRKLLRDLVQLRGQVVTIALVVGAGIAAFVAIRSTYGALRDSQAAYYDRYRFGDVFAHLERAPNSLADRLREIDGVATVYPRVVDRVRLPMPGMPEPAVATLVSLPGTERAPVNGVHLVKGRRPEPGRDDEALVLEAFANAHGLVPGDRLDAVIHGTLREIRVVGLAMSPEFVFAMAAGQMAPDEKKFAVLWMDRDGIAPAFDMEGAFNDVALLLQPGASTAAVKERVDRILEPWGGLGAVARDRQISHFALEQEMTQLQSMATTAPAIFLFVAAFLLNIVMSRMITLQRPQIAALKALGYANQAVGVHYLKLVCLIVLIGTTLGVLAGQWLGREFTELYTRFFHFPLLRFRIDGSVLATGVLVSLGAGIAGTLGAVRRVVRLAPAEAMRPPPPTSYRAGITERLGLWRPLGPIARMILREVTRRPLRLLLSSFGIALAVGIMVVGASFADAMAYLIDDFMASSQREDMEVIFQGPTDGSAARELAHLPGVLRVEGMRSVPVRFVHGARERDGVIIGYPTPPRLRRLIDRHLDPIPPPQEGVALTRTLAEILGLRLGDTVRVEVREGDRPVRDVPVAALVDELMGLQGHMALSSLNRLMGDQDVVSSAVLAIDAAQYPALRDRLTDMPGVQGLSLRDTMIALFREQSGENVRVFTWILTLFAAVIAVGVVYNNARISLSMRSRDLASLRVLGFTRGEISTILLGELFLQVALAIPIGLTLGRAMAEGMMSQTDPEMYRLPTIISGKTYAFATVVTLAAALLSALLVRRKLDRLDLIGVLKTRE